MQKVSMNMDLKTSKSLDSILLAFGENDHLDRDSVLKLFNNNENEAAKHINILAQFNHIKKIAEIEGSKLGLAFLKEDNSDLLLAQGGFTELYLKAAEEKKNSDDRQKLADENARLENEAHKHQATIRDQEDRIRSLDEKLKQFEMLKNYEWLIRLSFGVGAALATWLINLYFLK